MSVKEKGKIDSKVGIMITTNTTKFHTLTLFLDMMVRDFVKFKAHEYNQSHHEKVSYLDIPIWQMIRYHFFTLQDDYSMFEMS